MGLISKQNHTTGEKTTSFLREMLMGPWGRWVNPAVGGIDRLSIDRDNTLFVT